MSCLLSLCAFCQPVALNYNFKTKMNAFIRMCVGVRRQQAMLVPFGTPHMKMNGHRLCRCPEWMTMLHNTISINIWCLPVCLYFYLVEMHTSGMVRGKTKLNAQALIYGLQNYVGHNKVFNARGTCLNTHSLCCQSNRPGFTKPKGT